MDTGLLALIVAFIIAILFILFAFYLLRNTVNLVQQGFVGVVTRLGEFRAIHEPGLAIIAPFIDSLVTVDMRETPLPGDRQEVITKDNVVVAVNATIFTQVVDAKQALFSIARFDVAIDALARTALRSVIGTLSLDEALSERERINVDVQEQMEAVTDKWGIRINRIEIVEITPPPQILQALALQKQADQEKRAKILQSEGAPAVRRQRRRRRPAGGDQDRPRVERQAAILRAEGQRQALILEAEGRAQAIATVYGAIKAAAPDPTLVAILQLDTLAKFAASPNTKIVIPAESAALLGAVQAIQSVLAQVPRGRVGLSSSARRRPVASSAVGLRSPVARPVDAAFGPRRGGGRPWRGCRRSPCRTSAGGSSARCRRRPSCSVSLVADLDPLRVTGAQLGHERIGQAGERVVDRIADMAMVDADQPSGGGTSSMTWRACSARLTVSSAPGVGGTVLDDAHRRPRAARCRTAWTRARSAAPTIGSGLGLGAQPVGALAVDDAALDEPVEGRVEGREPLDRETILGVVGVQEVEGVLEADVVGVSPDRQPRERQCVACR